MMKSKHFLLSLVLLAILSACGSQTPPYQGVKLGKPYEIAGRTYKPKYEPSYDETGIASWYGPGFHGAKTASGERYNQNDMTAAHKTLPLPSIVRVTNLDNGRSALVRINDRGPFASNRIIDLSRAAAIKLGVFGSGTAKVRVQFLDQETRDYVSTLPNGPKSLLALDKSREANGISSNPMLPQVTDESVADNAPVQENDSNQNAAPTQDIFSVVDTSAPAQNAPAQMAQPVAYQQPSYNSNNNAPQDMQGTYFVQAGTFGVKGNADRLVQQLETMSNARVVVNMVGERTFYRVLAGPFSSNGEAIDMLSKLGGMGISGAKIIKG